MFFVFYQDGMLTDDKIFLFFFFVEHIGEKFLVSREWRGCQVLVVPAPGGTSLLLREVNAGFFWFNKKS